MKHTVIGMDIAKHVFQLHTVDAQTGEIERLKLRRVQVREFFVKRAPSVVAVEACGGAHYWGRELRTLGHEVRLLAPKSVRPFVRSSKDDAADAQAIWTAVQQPGAPRRAQERSAAGHPDAAPHARAAVEVPGDANQRLTRFLV